MALCVLFTSQVPAQGVRNGGKSERVVLHCDELTPEVRAAVEARLTGELLVSAVAAKLSLACTSAETSGTVQWAESSWGDSRQRSASLSEDLLALGMGLMEHAVQMQAEQGGDELETNNSVLLAEAQPGRGDVIVSRSDSGSQAASLDSDHDRRTVPFAILLGGAVVYQHFGTQVAGAMGPRAEGLIMWNGRGGLSLEVEPMFALAAPQGYHLWELRGQLTGFGRVLPWLSIGGGPLLSWVTVDGPAGSQAPKTGSFRPGLLGYVEGIFIAKKSEWYVRFGVSALNARRVIEQDQMEVLRVPQVQVLMSLGFRLATAKGSF